MCDDQALQRRKGASVADKLIGPSEAEARNTHADEGLTCVSAPQTLWTTVNASEVMPGVMRPLSGSYYAYATEVGLRRGLYDLGMVSARGAVLPVPASERLMGSFRGRLAANVDVARRTFAALPGVKGEDVERDLLGSARKDFIDVTDLSRVPAVLTRVPRILTTGRGVPSRTRQSIENWWRTVVDGDQLRSGLRPEQVLAESLTRFTFAMRLQMWMRMLIQAVSAQLTSISELAGQQNAMSTLLAGAAGTDEARIADDLYLVATERMSLGNFLVDHGYQGPNSGDPAARVWREDRRPLERILGAIAQSEPPAQRRARAVAERERVVASILSHLPAHRRPAARLAIRLAPAAARAIQGNKASTLLAIDCGRAATRALGAELVAAGTLTEPDDAFHLFSDELVNALRCDPGEITDLVSRRRALRTQLLQVTLPETWLGAPVEVPLDALERRDVSEVTGLGASPGIVEGRVRVVLDSADDVDIDNGDILVCPTTDPSWVSLMTVAAAVVIDIGAAVSHGAIVARELGVPCVIGTSSGTRDLRDGDLVRVDGSTGVVEVLERGRPAAAHLPG
jgi:pyruvate, water dikinase